MKKIFVIITAILAICGTAFAGCGSGKTDVNSPAPENTQIVQSEETDDGNCEEPGCQEDITEVPVPPRHFRGRHRGPRKGRDNQPEPCPMPRQMR